MMKTKTNKNKMALLFLVLCLPLLTSCSANEKPAAESVYPYEDIGFVMYRSHSNHIL